MNHRTPVIPLLAFVLLLLIAPSSHALERETLAAPPDPSGLLVVTPARVEMDIEPGVRSTIAVEIYNEDSVPLDVSLIPYDLGPATSDDLIASRAEQSEFGTKEWVQFEQPNLRLKPFERVKVEVYLDPPVNAPVGTNLGSIAVRGGPASGDIGTFDDTSVLQIDALVQLFVTIPGDVEHGLSIADLSVRDSFVIGSTRIAVMEASFRNNGNVNEHVNGTLKLQSIFGTTAHEIKLKDFIVLRGATRTKRFVWRDMPWVGIFTPELEIEGDAGERLTRKGDRIIVMPWWVPVVILLALVVPPLVVWWRRRNDWMQYLDEEDMDEWSDPERASG